MKTIHKVIQKLLKAVKFVGRDFLIEKLPKWFLKTPKGPVVIETVFGFKIKLDPVFDKNIENVIYERGVYEQGTVSVLLDFLSPENTFLDVGANIGFLSLIAAKQIGEKGSVYAFEPFPNTYDILKENKSLNSYDQIKTFAFALGNQTETKSIYPEKENRGGASIVNHISDGGIDIDIKRIDDLTLTTKVDVIKIDVEGFELEVLKGGQKIIINDRPKLIVEHSMDRTNTAEKFELYHWINDLGIYKIYKLKNGKERESALVEIKSLADLPVHDNIFCIPFK